MNKKVVLVGAAAMLASSMATGANLNMDKNAQVNATPTQNLTASAVFGTCGCCGCCGCGGCSGD
jgi:hypothetical protein